MKAWCSYCGEDVDVKNGKLVPHEDIYPTRACEGGNRPAFEGRVTTGLRIENLKCPHCLGPMESRKNGQTQQRFWGCKNYPQCHGTRNTDGEAYSHMSERNFEGSDGGPLPSERLRTNDRGRFRNH